MESQVRLVGFDFVGAGLCGEGCSERITDIRTVNFTKGSVIGNVYQSEDNLFAEEELRKRVSVRIFEEIGRKELGRVVGKEKMVSSPFVA